MDIGKKRTGVAATDTLKIIANGIGTVSTSQVIEFLTKYMATNSVDLIVVGMPKQMNNEPSEAVKYIEPVINRIRKLFPTMEVKLVDERFTSKLAHRAMIDGGLKKMDRRNKALVDTISATIILQSYLESVDFDKLK